nr:2-oxo-4-hydroxy-4-carboxy-5-ureidoimidazoline decarboxylase [Gemmatimonadaceae bacterium]
QLLDTADATWASLTPADWREAFDHHPRLGESRSTVQQGARAAAWSSVEQSRVSTAAEGDRAALATANAEYEARFGFICIICAAGRSAEELLAITRGRLDNPPADELGVAAEEQRKITRLRLAKLFHDPMGAPSS